MPTKVDRTSERMTNSTRVSDLYEQLSLLGDRNRRPEQSQQSKGETGTAKILNAKILNLSPIKASAEKLIPVLGDGHQFFDAHKFADAMAILSTQQIDLILIDHWAPEAAALEFCRILKRTPATQTIPVFVLASHHDVQAEVRALEAGADEFLVWPQNPAGFRARVRSKLRHKAIVDSLDDSETVLFSLAQSVEERDPDLGHHCTRLALMAAAMGLAMGLPSQDILALQRGGFLHDIGKIAVPDRFLFKQGPLTPQEWEVVKTHADRGERICSGMKALEPVLPIIRHHHERWDGSGYPDGLKGEEIPLLARIMQLADIYDALTTLRPYKTALSPLEALQVIREEAQRGWREPKLVAIFADLLPVFRSTAAAPDFSQLSLHALVTSVELYRKEKVPRRGPAKVELVPRLARAS